MVQPVLHATCDAARRFVILLLRPLALNALVEAICYAIARPVWQYKSLATKILFDFTAQSELIVSLLMDSRNTGNLAKVLQITTTLRPYLRLKATFTLRISPV